MRAGRRVPLRSRDDALPRRGAGRPHPPRGRGAARELRAAGPVLIARLVVWNLADSKTTLDELRDYLPELEGEDRWISNEPQERLGLISFGEELPNLGEIPALIGKEPDVAEEFDLE